MEKKWHTEEAFLFQIVCAFRRDKKIIYMQKKKKQTNEETGEKKKKRKRQEVIDFNGTASIAKLTPRRGAGPASTS